MRLWGLGFKGFQKLLLNMFHKIKMDVFVVHIVHYFLEYDGQRYDAVHQGVIFLYVPSEVEWQDRIASLFAMEITICTRMKYISMKKKVNIRFKSA